jgi:hypothetical protein
MEQMKEGVGMSFLRKAMQARQDAGAGFGRFCKAAMGVTMLAAGVCAGAAQAQTTAPVGAGGQASGLTPEQIATMQHDMDAALHYHLAPDILPRLSATLQSIQAAGILPPARYGMSLDQQVGLVEQVPGLAAILKEHGLTAHDFVMSLTCVGLTTNFMNVPPSQMTGNMPTPDAQNVALLKSNPKALQELVGVLRGGRQSSTSVH